MLTRALKDGADYALFLEDDLLFNFQIRHNLLEWLPVCKGWLWMGSLYNPGITPSPDADLALCWKNRFLPTTPEHFFGAQAIVLSHQALCQILHEWNPNPHWDHFIGQVAARASRRLIAHVPSLIQHVPVTSTWGGWYHRALDFDPFYRADSNPETKPEHFFEWIPGWFDYQELYARIVREAPEKAHFVEVGAWFGRSTAYLAIEILRSGKSIRHDVVDHWQGGKGEAIHETILKHTDVYTEFAANMQRGGVAEKIHVVRADSTEAAARYPDGSIDFVFLDGSHDWESVLSDVLAWKPKIRPGGVLAGHDWGRFEVQPAVLSVFDPHQIEVLGFCWIWRTG